MPASTAIYEPHKPGCRRQAGAVWWRSSRWSVKSLILRPRGRTGSLTVPRHRRAGAACVLRSAATPPTEAAKRPTTTRLLYPWQKEARRTTAALRAKRAPATNEHRMSDLTVGSLLFAQSSTAHLGPAPEGNDEV